MCALESEGSGTAFDKRAAKALERRKVPTDSGDVIALPDQSSSVEENTGQKDLHYPPQLIPDGSENKEAGPKQFFTLVYKEIPEAPEGGYFVADQNADPAGPEVFTRGGQKYRPVTPEEHVEITAIMADPIKRREKGANRLPTLTPSEGGEANTDTVEDKKEPESEKLDPEKFTRMINSANWTGQGEQGDFYEHPDAPGKKFTKEEIDAMREPTKEEGGGGKPPEDPPKGGPEDQPEKVPEKKDGPEEQNVGKIAAVQGAQMPGRYVSWRNPDPMKYDGIKTLDTRQDIIANPRNAQLFGEMLQAMGESDDPAEALGAAQEKTRIAARWERYQNGTATKDDADFVTYATKEFSRAITLAEGANSHLNKQNLELFSRRNSDMENILVQEGENRAAELIRASIFHAAMRRPDDVESLLKNLNKLEKDRASGAFQKWNTEVKELCEAVDIKDLKNFDALYDMSESGKNETRRRVTARMREQMNKYEKAVDAVSFGIFGRNKAEILMNRADWVVRMRQGTFVKQGSENPNALVKAMNWISTGSTQRRVMGADASMESIAGFLGNTIGTDEMRSLVAKEVMENRNYSFASEGGPKTFAETQKLTEKDFSERAIKTRLEERIKNDGNWKTGGDAYQDQKLGEWRQEEEKGHEGKGFWAWLFTTILGKNYEKAARSVTGRAAHA